MLVCYQNRVRCMKGHLHHGMDVSTNRKSIAFYDWTTLNLVKLLTQEVKDRRSQCLWQLTVSFAVNKVVCFYYIYMYLNWCWRNKSKNRDEEKLTLSFKPCWEFRIGSNQAIFFMPFFSTGARVISLSWEIFTIKPSCKHFRIGSNQAVLSMVCVHYECLNRRQHWGFL